MLTKKVKNEIFKLEIPESLMLEYMAIDERAKDMGYEYDLKEFLVATIAKQNKKMTRQLDAIKGETVSEGIVEADQRPIAIYTADSETDESEADGEQAVGD